MTRLTEHDTAPIPGGADAHAHRLRQTTGLHLLELMALALYTGAGADRNLVAEASVEDSDPASGADIGPVSDQDTGPASCKGLCKAARATTQASSAAALGNPCPVRNTSKSPLPDPVTPERIQAACAGRSVDVIPIASGGGVIADFAAALACIARRLGMRPRIRAAQAWPPQLWTQDGQREEAAHPRLARDAVLHGWPDDDALRIWADDDAFVVQDPSTGAQAENGEATGRGFAAALHAMLPPAIPGHRPARILVRGCGPVGAAAARHLLRLGRMPLLCDVDREKAQQLAQELGLPLTWACTAHTLPRILATGSAPWGNSDTVAVSSRYVAETSTVTSADANSISATVTQWVTPSRQSSHPDDGLLDAILDAAPGFGEQPQHLLAPLLADNAVIAAPGVPCPWEPLLRSGQRVWHDPLETGTAVMLAAAALGRNL